MASAQTLQAVITVLDRTAEPLHQMNQRFERLSAPLRNIGDRLATLAEETGLKKVGEQAGEAFAHVRELGAGLFEMLGPLAALGAAGSAAGLIEIAKSTAEFGEQLKLGAVAAGVSTQALSGWHYAAQLANVDVEELDRGFQYLNRNIAMAAMGKAKDVEAILSRMGFSNTQGHLVGTADALRAVAAEAKHLVDSGQVQLADAMMGQLFGERSGMQLLPLFEKGPAAIGEILEAARKHGISFSDEQAENATRFAEGYKGMTAAVDGLRFAIGDRLFPVLTPIVERMTQWLDVNRGWIATHVEKSVTSLADALASVDFKQLIRDTKQVVDEIGHLIDRTIGVKGTLIAIAAISFAPTILAFGQLGAAVVSVAARLVVFPLAAMAIDFARLIPTIGGLTDAFAAFNLVVAANPIGVAVIAAAALGAAAYEIYEHWDAIVPLLRRAMDAIGQIFTWTYDHTLKPLIDAIERLGRWAGIATPPQDEGIDWQGNPVSPRQGVPAPGAPPLTQLRGGGPAGTPASAAAAQKSQADIHVKFDNLPPNASTKVETKGPVDLDVGYAFAPG